MAKKDNYAWKFRTIGGVTRVCIESGEDIAHLGELDQKLWTVLSCPTKGLEFDEKTLAYLDGDHDGKIRANEVIEASQWLTKVLNDNNLLLKHSSSIPLSAFNQETEEGKRLWSSAKQILHNLKIEGEEISLEHTADSIAIFAQTRFNGDGIITEQSSDDAEIKQTITDCIATLGSKTDRSGAEGIDAEEIELFYQSCMDYATWKGNCGADQLPYGENTEAALSACEEIHDKVKDFFMRCKMAAFDSDCTSALDVVVERVSAISDKNLSTCVEEIANYPLARISSQAQLPVNGNLNPAWQAKFNAVKNLVLDVDYKDKEFLLEEDWNAIMAKFDAFKAWKADKKGENVEALGLERIQNIVKLNNKESLLKLVEEDKALETEAGSIEEVDKLLHLYRDFHTLLNNYVTFSDFYSRKDDTKAIFQAGTLIIDQRSCDLCIRVADMGTQGEMANLSGMYILYCDCVSKVKNAKMTIAAVLTDGDVNDLRVGKNAIFYDRNGQDWDATVIKIVENPISIREAFWSPYRKFGRWCTNLVNKMASEKENKGLDQMTAKASEAQADLATQASTGEKVKKERKPFDIATFCGIFAAIGMAVGYLASALTDVGKGLAELKPWQILILIVGILLVISGPSMFIAWTKLRKRNIGPVLNANGWAINSRVKVNTTFGATLTDLAKTPKVSGKDPFADKTPWGRYILTFLVIAGLVIWGLFKFTNIFGCKTECEDTTEVTDTTAVAQEEIPTADTVIVEAEQ